MKEISESLKKHYSESIEKFGANAKGVDWGTEEKAILRSEVMLNVCNSNYQGESILDIGCGYGAFNTFLVERGIDLKYSGIDISEKMIDKAKQLFPECEFICGDILDIKDLPQYDYLICNGIFTQKLAASDSEMMAYMNEIVQKMFSICKKGVAFNVMTNQVDFKNDGNFYVDSSVLINNLFQITRKMKIDHSYPLYEFTVYLYK